MGRPKKSAVKSFWQQAEFFETSSERIDRQEAEALEKFKKQREELRANTPKAVLDAIRAKARAEERGEPEPAPVVSPVVAPKPVTNGASKQVRATA